MKEYGDDRYEEDDERDDVIKYRPPYNPDKIRERAVNEAIHGYRKMKPMSYYEQYQEDLKYDNFLKVKKKTAETITKSKKKGTKVNEKISI